MASAFICEFDYFAKTAAVWFFKKEWSLSADKTMAHCRSNRWCLCFTDLHYCCSYSSVLKISVCECVIQSHISSHDSIEFAKSHRRQKKNPCKYKTIILECECSSVQRVQAEDELVPLVLIRGSDTSSRRRQNVSVNPCVQSQSCYILGFVTHLMSHKSHLSQRRAPL